MVSINRNAWEKVERALGSVGKLRIMRELLREPNEARSRYVLGKRTHLKLQDIKKHLKVLTSLGWVKENVNDPRTYRVNMENLAVQAFRSFLWELKREKDGEF